MNIFDSVKRSAFDVVSKTMGYDAVWITESETFNARVCFRDPSEKEELSGIDSWNPNEPFMEYRIDFFPGLKEKIDSGKSEFVSILSIGYFAISEIRTKFDGQTFIARLIKTTP